MNCCGCRCDAREAAVALARWGMGIMLLSYGVGKLIGYPGFVDQLTGRFEEAWLPGILVAIFAYALPFVEVLLGPLLLLGICRNVSLFAAGVLFILLTFGSAVLGDPPTVSDNLLYVFMAAALLYLEAWDRWVVPMGNVSRESG